MLTSLPCTWRGVLRLAGAQTIKTDREETECWAVERFYMQPWVAAGLRSPIWEAGRAILMFRVAWWCCGVVLVLECSIHFLRRSCDVLFKSECNYSHANCKNRFMVLEIIYKFLDCSTEWGLQSCTQTEWCKLLFASLKSQLWSVRSSVRSPDQASATRQAQFLSPPG